MGHYSSALAHYETVIGWGVASKAVRKRAVICYIETHHPEKALPIYASLVEEDPAYLLHDRSDSGGCPCPGIIQHYADTVKGELTSMDMMALGMLWSCCDLHMALLWFEKVARREPVGDGLRKIHAILSSHLVTSPS